MSETARQRRTLDLGSMKPAGVDNAPPVEAVKAVAEGQGFSSRKAAKPADADPVSPAPATPSRGPGRRRVGARRKGRTEALNIRVKPEVYDRVVEICDSREYGYAEFLDEALAAWEARNA